MALTDDEAEWMLEQLTEHFGQPVMPLRRFCEAVSTWFRVIESLNKSKSTKDGDPRERQGRVYWQHLRHIESDIRKSNLLARMLYAGEPLRRMRCPLHKGHFTSDLQECRFGCDGTGWLK